ncbi:hypothetical protein DQ353_11450 [Arthrobacter sp. AQ5-05]|uniref:alanine-tRNA synthetase second additional domain-containing protein n=1 Tax=Arthrobacter sp. AQ5-05 TaxID=2184581 RepID=UPI000DCC0285|nr:alanine-tRNA synthetase second additional domain-containing protein [Arthrobacter sp. AQ5-05]RAX49174.1 hypothetical protein DQ353_11450 [Arthrobacter sp. AQ5-05]
MQDLADTKAPVTSNIDTHGIRTVAIAGVNAEPCGGTHASDLGALKGCPDAGCQDQARALQARALKVRHEATHA